MRLRIYRMKEIPRENFRWSAHTGGLAVVKAKDYEAAFEELDAASPYSAWNILKTQGKPLLPGDLLETLNEEGVCSHLQITKYIGFEPAQWFIPEPKAERPDSRAQVTAYATELADRNSESPAL